MHRATDVPAEYDALESVTKGVTNGPHRAALACTPTHMTKQTPHRQVAKTIGGTTIQVWNAADKLLTGYRQVPDPAPGAVSSNGINVTVPASTTPGDYYLLACADDTALVVEASESNNCEASTTRVTVLP